MSTLELTEDAFEAVITDNKIVLIDFWASWCGPCRSFAPIYEAASDVHSDVVFAKVDTEAERRLAGMFGISSIPTLVAFREQIVVFSQAGALPAPALEQVISAVKDLDMDDVRRQLAAQQAEASRGTIDIEAFAAQHAQGAAVVDVRERGEWLGGHLSGSQLIPMSQIGARVQDFPTDRPVYLVCTSGSRSGQAAAFLRDRGIDAINVAGGIAAWEQRGWALERGA